VREVVRQTLNPLWSAYSFFALYANADNYQATYRTDSQHVLDRYILAKTNDLVQRTAEALDAYDLAGATEVIQEFLNALTNWYIRRSRERFWNTDETGRSGAVDVDALDTLYSVLATLARVAAPLLPYVAEEIWTGLTGSDSVHLQSWPEADELPADPDLVRTMDQLRDAASAALSLRDSHGLRIRQPLTKAVVAGSGVDGLESLQGLLADEINVKKVEFSDDVEAFGSFRLQPNSRVLGPRMGGEVQAVISEAKAGHWSLNDDGTAQVGRHVLAEGEFTLALVPNDGVAAAPLPGNTTVIALDTSITPELEAEGFARDLVRAIQQERKDRDFNVTDRIQLSLSAPSELANRLDDHMEWIESQVLAVEVVPGSDLPATATVGPYEIAFDVRPLG